MVQVFIDQFFPVNVAPLGHFPVVCGAVVRGVGIINLCLWLVKTPSCVIIIVTESGIAPAIATEVGLKIDSNFPFYSSQQI